MKTEKQPKQETLEEVRMVKRTELYNSILSIVKQLPRKEVQDDAMDAPSCAYELEQLFLKWQQEQEQNNENSWFNEYQNVEDYIIKRIGDKFLDATPEKYNTASEATIALLENNWQQEKNKNLYSEEESIQKIIDYVDFQFNTNGELNSEIKKWFEQFKKK